MRASSARFCELGILETSSCSNSPSFAYSQPTCDVVKVISLSGLPFASFSLLSRSIVPPVMYSTGTPVTAVNFLPMRLSTISRQLPPQTLTTSLSCAMACIGARNRASAAMILQIRFMSHLSHLLDDPFDARRICRGSSKHLSISGSSLFVETAELVQRRGKSAASGAVAPPARSPREAWLTPHLEGRLPATTGVDHDGSAPRAEQTDETGCGRK